MSNVWFTADLPLSPLTRDEPVAAYWNGFIMADGTFTGVGGNRMKVALARKDHSHIELLVAWLGKGNIHRSKRGSKFDIQPRKTYNPPGRLPFEDEALLTSWMIGFIDGDGHIKNQTGRETATMNMNIHLSWKPFLHLLSERLAVGTVSTRSGEYARFTISRHNELVALKLFAQANELPFLARKWERVDESVVLDRYERAERTRELIRSGLPNKEVAALTGSSHSSVCNIRKRMIERSEL